MAMSRGGEAYREALRRQQLQMEALERIAPTVSFPVHDSADAIPGWIFVAEEFSTIPDAVYPYDPAVLRAVREFCPDAQPLTIRSIWRRSRADGKPEHKVIVRHGLARKLDPTSIHIAPHRFACSRPHFQSYGGVRTVVPDYIEVNWYDKEVRPDGFDMPGAYLPFDWEFYHSLRRSYTDSVRGRDLAARLIDPYRRRRDARDRQRAEEVAYRAKDLHSYYREEPSTPEWEAALAGHVKRPSAPVSVTVSAAPQKFSEELIS